MNPHSQYSATFSIEGVISLVKRKPYQFLKMTAITELSQQNIQETPKPQNASQSVTGSKLGQY